ncbi:MAG: c-type cytochrome [Desulfovibrionaceae bacterium]|nr:c-type cytochrome [Desulfovibrionaceae bacterium]
MKRSLQTLIAAAGLSLITLAAGAAPADDRDKDYVWNQMYAEKLQVLKTQGDALRGEIAFEICQGCHRHNAVGREDGSYPRLAGQHASVLIKQMTDVRSNRRQNKKMRSFIDTHVITPQEIADIAMYLQSLPVTPDNGKGEGDNLAQGETLYKRDCVSCHGAKGEGDEAKFYPRVSGQHYKYLLREGRLIRDGGRGNANPDMMKAVKPYSDADLKAVVDYMSRLPL